MAKTGRHETSLTSTAEAVGTALGEVAARIDRWREDQASIAADLRSFVQSAHRMLDELGERAAAGFTTARQSARKGGRPKGYKASPETRAKLRAAWERRRASDAITRKQPVDERSIIRSKAARTWSNRQPGRG